MSEVVREDMLQNLVATFLVEDVCYGIETGRVEEVVWVSEITPVNHAPEYVMGVMNLRGKIVTILDLGKKLGLEKIRVSCDSRVFIVSWNQESVGLLVDQVGEVVPLEKDALLPTPENFSKESLRQVGGVFKSGEKLITLLKLDEVLK